MAWLPGWDSIETASKWQDIYFWLGVICLALVIVSGIISHRYGGRKDELIAMSVSNRAAQVQRDRQIADELHKAEVQVLGAQLAEVDRKVSRLQEQQAQRRLSADQVKALIEALSPFKGQKVAIASLWGNAESKAFAEQFLPIFSAVGWQHTGVSETTFDKGPVGIEVTVNKSEADAGHVLKAADVLVRTLILFGLTKGGAVHPSVPKDTIQLRIGPKALIEDAR